MANLQKHEANVLAHKMFYNARWKTFIITMNDYYCCVGLCVCVFHYLNSSCMTFVLNLQSILNCCCAVDGLYVYVCFCFFSLSQSTTIGVLDLNWPENREAIAASYWCESRRGKSSKLVYEQIWNRKEIVYVKKFVFFIDYYLSI